MLTWSPSCPCQLSWLCNKRNEYMNCKCTWGYYKNELYWKICARLFTVSFVSVLDEEKRERKKGTGWRLQYRLIFQRETCTYLPNFAVCSCQMFWNVFYLRWDKESWRGIESTCEPTTSSSNFPLHYLVSTAWRFISWNLVYDHSRDCVYENHKKI